jgi:DegV family protein with EDD domain
VERERRVNIITDAAADLPSEQGLKTIFGVGPVRQVPIFIDFGEDRYITRENDPNYKPINIDDFRKRVDREIESKSGIIPKTSAVGETYFDEAYRSPIEQGYDVLSIHVSKEISATLNSATIASKKNEGNRVSIFDTQTVSMAQGLMVIEAERMAASGATKDEIIEMLTDMRERTTLRAVTPDFKFLVASGRVPGVKAMIGKVLSLVPILGIDHITDKNKVSKKRTVRKGYMAVDWMEEYIKNNNPEQVAIVDYRARQTTEKLKNILIKEGILPEDRIYLGDLGPVTSSHGGPGTWGVITVRKK